MGRTGDFFFTVLRAEKEAVQMRVGDSNKAECRGGVKKGAERLNICQIRSFANLNQDPGGSTQKATRKKRRKGLANRVSFQEN